MRQEVNKMEKKINTYLLITIITTIFFVFIGGFYIYVYEIICVQIVRRVPLDTVANIFDINYWDYKLEDNLQNNLKYSSNEISLNTKYKKLIKENKLWLQIIDKNGNEVYNYLKPDNYPEKYTIISLTSTLEKPHWESGYSINSSNIKLNNTTFSFLIGYPNRNGLSYRQNEIFKYTLIRVVYMGLIIILASIVASRIFSKKMIKPLFNVVKSIENLANENYDNIFKDNRIYIEVSNNLYKLALKLKKSKIERKKLEKSRNELITNIVHDIKTPLSSIKGYIEMLSYEKKYNLTDDEKKNYTQITIKKTDYIDKLLEEISLCYKLNSNTYKIIKKDYNLVNILKHLIINILNDINYNNRTINFDFDFENTLLNCDKILIERAFNNIIYNALIHNSVTTTITISIKSTDNLITVKIEDNGEGINDEEIDKLFNRYYRGTNTKQNTNGSGLGLAIAKQIIENHYGIINIKSILKKGTIIKITFPKKLNFSE
jgi:signal transduction histidine kinase